MLTLYALCESRRIVMFWRGCAEVTWKISSHKARCNRSTHASQCRSICVSSSRAPATPIIESRGGQQSILFLLAYQQILNISLLIAPSSSIHSENPWPASFFYPLIMKQRPLPHAVWRRLCLAPSTETLKFNSGQGYHGTSESWQLAALMRLENYEGASFFFVYIDLC